MGKPTDGPKGNEQRGYAWGNVKNSSPLANGGASEKKVLEIQKKLSLHYIEKRHKKKPYTPNARQEQNQTSFILSLGQKPPSKKQKPTDAFIGDGRKEKKTRKTASGLKTDN